MQNINFIFNAIYNAFINLFFKRKYFTFFIFLLIFIITRFSIISSFPIFNDESIYLQYSQIINTDFDKYKFISMGGLYNDYKPPLQFWIGSLFINDEVNPLLIGRMVSIFFSIIGFIGIYLFVLNLYGRKEAFLSAFFYIISSQTLLYNTIFIAETYVFSTAALLYFFSLQIIKSPIYKIRVWSLIGAVICGAALMLFKQSGLLYLYLLPILYFTVFNFGTAKTEEDKKWRQIIFMTTILIIALSFLLYAVVIPSKFIFLENKFTERWTMSFSEILSFPFNKWFANLKKVWDFYLHYYTLAIIPFIAGFAIFSFIKKDIRDIVIFMLFILSSGAVIFGLSGFNEYIYHTAIVFFLTTILARCVVLISNLGFYKHKGGWLVYIFAALLVLIIIGSWSYQIILMRANPVKYFENGTKWTFGNYIQSWASGYGVKPVIDFLMSQEKSTLVFADPQWGNPRTSLEVFHNYYPNVKIMPMYADFFQSEFKKKIIGKNDKIDKFVIFSSSPRDWQSYVYKDFCSKMRKFKEIDNQYPIIVCKIN